jgi:hypothetical protein
MILKRRNQKHGKGIYTRADSYGGNSYFETEEVSEKNQKFFKKIKMLLTHLRHLKICMMMKIWLFKDISIIKYLIQVMNKSISLKEVHHQLG